MSPEKIEVAAKAICKSRKFETGRGTCALLCMDQLGDARSKCPHCVTVHGELAEQILTAIRDEGN